MAINETADGDSSIAISGAATGGNSVGVRGTGDATGVRGDGKSWHGVEGFTESKKGGAGVFGQSNSDSSGVWGIGTSGAGVTGESTSGAGITGTSTQGNGVYGRGPTGGFFEGGSGAGVRAVGLDGGPAILATGTHGPAAVFDGRVNLRGDLEVSGDIRLLTPGGDVAELFTVDPASTSSGAAEPGTVMVLTGDGHVTPSSSAYDRRVIGVVAGAGVYRPGMVLDSGLDDAAPPIAMLGKVYCKADASYGEIEVGDLLTTCPTPGFAMKVGDGNRAFGAVIGKALGRLREGRGLMPLVVALQ